MKKIILITLSIFILNVPCFADQYKVLRVIDGDTIDINYNDKKERVRMLCVNTPESVHPDQSKNCEMGRKASAYTKYRLAGKSVDLEFESKTRGKYGRLLAYVILDGENFNLELIQKGWSKYYTKYGTSERHHAKFLTWEKEARSQGLNIWSARSENSEVQPVVAGEYHGNISSRKFHRPGCKYYNCSKCTRVFNSRYQAISAGYEPCKICKP
ncbi:thermonuclease family protein [Desulfobacula phenolica]|uniref:Micrococcal nuclease n=1 Tax=Desulfobacula phenolica TaxID=90732 RepID=A0A1H2H6G7_9BACT|nr:thermonuclease family protein [Desulfobacula phenolica]SDU27477.1 micrococcal nuclease [Desulfobacula phenolica]